VQPIPVIQKTTHNVFAKSKKSMSKTFPKNDKTSDVSFSSIFLVSSRFRVFRSDGSSKALQKAFLQKNRAEKFLQKTDINPQLIFVRSFLITSVGVSR
jgi:hypothetical protein